MAPVAADDERWWLDEDVSVLDVRHTCLARWPSPDARRHVCVLTRHSELVLHECTCGFLW